jgi:nifR3 family TIM-barrel protein
MKTFWHTLRKPILGLAPMDGITDPAFRAVVDDIGHPSVLYSEFVSAEGLNRNFKRLLRIFMTHQTATPFVGQLFGADAIAMEEAASILLEKTFVSGIDINMGCPNRHVTGSGGGAALIFNPKLARKLIQAVRKAVTQSKKPIGISVKTRLGIDSVVTESWIPNLLEEQPDAIALHGRTLKQLFTGHADWNEIHKAARIAQKTKTLLLGNGDISSFPCAQEHIKKYSPDGILIGRATFGNPWIFQNISPDLRTRIHTAIHHIHLFHALTPDGNPLSLRKHLAWYIKGFPDASLIRQKIIKLSTTKQMLDFLSSLPYSD